METIRHQQVQRPRPPRRKRSRGPLIAGVGIVALGCLLVALLAGYLLLAPPASASIGSNVQITTPTMGDVVAINVKEPVQASATSPKGISRIELYADGALVAVQESELPAGNNPAIMFKPWIPLSLGRHILIARAYPIGGEIVDSPAIAVNVVDQVIRSRTFNTGENETSLSEISAAEGVAPEDIFIANPGLPNAFDSPLPPGTDIIIPIPPAPPPPPVPPPPPLPGTPAAPTNLVVNADCTQATLSWTDAPDETEYKIYRLDAPLLVHIATVPANTTNYVDTPLPGLGEFQYQVASVKDSLEGLTPLVAVTTPGACLPPPPAVADLILTMETLVTDSVWDGVFCYFDFNGTGYQRVPAADFLYMTPEPDGKTYDLSTQLPDGGQFHVSADEGAGLTLAGECWGRLGPVVSLLGNVSATHGPADWDGHPLIQSALLEGGSGKVAAPHMAPNMTLNYHITTNPPPVPPVIWPPWLDWLLGLLQLPAPTNLHIGPSGAGCGELAGLTRLICLLQALVGNGPVTLTWDWTGNIFHSESDLSRYYVVMRAHDLTSGAESVIWTKNVYRAAPGEEIRRGQILPTEGLPCGSQLLLDVRAFRGLQVSSISTIPWKETDPCPSMDVTVTFDTFHLNPTGGNPSVQDVPGEFCWLCPPPDERLELVGSMGVGILYFETGNSGGLPFQPCPGDAWCIGQGAHPVAGLPLSFWGWGVPSLGNNHLNFTLDSDYGLTIWFGFTELNYSTPSDASCDATLEFPPTNPVNWPTQINGTHTLTGVMTGSGGGLEGECSLDVTINGVPAP